MKCPFLSPFAATAESVPAKGGDRRIFSRRSVVLPSRMGYCINGESDPVWETWDKAGDIDDGEIVLWSGPISQMYPLSYRF